MIIDRPTYKKIEFYLYSYFDIKKALEEERQNIIAADNREIIRVGQKMKTDKTAEKAIKLTADNIVSYEKWIKVVDLVVEHFDGTDMGEVLAKRYFKKETEKDICTALHIERSTYYYWRKEIVLFTVMLGIKQELIDLNI